MDIPLHGDESVGERLYHELRSFALNAYPHQRVASGRRLAAKYGVSHTTVMSVVDRLVGEKLVYKKHGKGIFVAERQMASPKTVVFAYSWPALSNVYYSRFWNGVVSTLESCEIRVEVRKYQTGERNSYSDFNRKLLEDAKRPEVGGMILPWAQPELEERLRKANPTLHLILTEKHYPCQHLTTVSADFYVQGAVAVDVACKSDARKIALVYYQKKDDYLRGALAAIEQFSGLELLKFPYAGKDMDTASLLASAVLECEADAVCFSDDYMAKNVLGCITEKEPDFPETCLIVSMANTGDSILPPYVVRVENDGYEVGRQAALAMEGMFSGRSLDNLDIKVKPSLVPPGVKRAG